MRVKPIILYGYIEPGDNCCFLFEHRQKITLYTKIFPKSNMIIWVGKEEYC